jgi:hypothetical protein
MLSWYRQYLLMQVDNIEKKYLNKIQQIENKLDNIIKKQKENKTKYIFHHSV